MLPLVIINMKESKEKSALIVNVYLGNGRVTKSNTYSGPLQICKNVDVFENRAVVDFFSDQENSLLEKGVYYINPKKFDDFIDLVFQGIVFYRSNEKKYVMLTSVKHDIPEKISEYYFDVENYSLCINSSCLYIWNSQKDTKEIIKVEPGVIIYIDLENSKNKLCFKYETNEISFINENDFIVNGDKRFVRDKIFENIVLDDLRNNGWKIKNNIFEYIGNDLIEEINRCISKGYTVLSPKGKSFFGTKTYNFNFSYQMDWFGLEGKIETDNHKYDLLEFIQNTNGNQHWVEFDDEIILVDKNIEKFKSYIHNGICKIPHSCVGDILYVNNKMGRNSKRILEQIEFEKCNIALDNIVFDKLRDYQKYGVKWLLYMYKNRMGCCLADDMGLGKTVQIISFLSDKSTRSDKSNIIIVPKTLIFNWQKEIKKFNPKMKINIYHGKDRILKTDADIILTTYGTLNNDIDILSKGKYNCIIMDECQYAKNDKTLTYKCLGRINGYIKIALSGTPIENNLAELWSLMNLLNSGIWGKPDLSITKENINAIKFKIAPFILRRKKEDVLKELPQKEIISIPCAMEKEQEDLYNTIFEATRLKLKMYPNSIGSIILEDMLYLRECCCHPKLLPYDYNVNNCNDSCKLEVLKQIVEQCIFSGNKIVIFSQFKKMLQIVEKWLSKSNIPSFILTGDTHDRGRVIEEFETSDASVLLISLKAGGVGINLTSAHYAVIYDPWWNPAAEKQAEDRLYRIGQKDNVIIYKLFVADTIEEKIFQLQQKKGELSEAVLNGRDDVVSLNKDIIEKLFM